jgi:hypothetical protein
MRVILLVEPDQAEREVLMEECNGSGFVITISDPIDACAILKALTCDLAVVAEERLLEPSFGIFYSTLRLTAPRTKLLSLPLPSCPP